MRTALLGLEKQDKFWQGCENYINVERKVLRVVSLEKQDKKVVIYVRKEYVPQPALTTFLKIVSYVSLILPLIALAYCSWKRSQYDLQCVAVHVLDHDPISHVLSFDDLTKSKESNSQLKSSSEKANTPLQFERFPQTPPEDLPLSNREKDDPLPMKKWNTSYKTCIPKDEEYQDSLDRVLTADDGYFPKVQEEWLNLSWFQQLPQSVQNDFRLFLGNIANMTIPRQVEVFRFEHEQHAAYTIFKKSIVYLFEEIQAQPSSDLGEMVVNQLNLAIKECPLAYFSAINTALDVVVDKKGMQEIVKGSLHKRMHQFYASKRKEIVGEMSLHFGRRETHTPNSIITLIGKCRKIPGYSLVIPDKQADLKDGDIPELLFDFDKRNSPQETIHWFNKKINGKIDFDAKGNPMYHLHQEIPDHLAMYFGVDIDTVRNVIFDENFQISTITIIACLELVGIITPCDKTISGLTYFERDLKDAMKEKLGITSDSHSPISLALWDEIPLRNLLILSDKCFYNVACGDADYIYLNQELIEKKTRMTPCRTNYTDDDLEAFNAKVKLLELQDLEPNLVETNSVEQVPSDPRSLYLALEKMIAELADVLPNGDFNSIIVDYLHVLEDEAIQTLYLPDLNCNLSASNWQELNTHCVVVYLWNALRAQGFQSSISDRALRNHAKHHRIPLRT